MGLRISYREFQSTHPSGVRPYPHRRPGRSRQISIHAPHPSGVRRLSLAVTVSPTSFQSTHPSGVRLRCSQRFYFNKSISIHAPQWGATGSATARTRSPKHFNPRTPVGCDRFDPHRFRRQPISIHAPQWGATYTGPCAFISLIVFQSTHPSGVRHDGVRLVKADNKFQSTHPSGVRQNRINEDKTR